MNGQILSIIPADADTWVERDREVVGQHHGVPGNWFIHEYRRTLFFALVGSPEVSFVVAGTKVPWGTEDAYVGLDQEADTDAWRLAPECTWENEAGATCQRTTAAPHSHRSFVPVEASA